jgi:transmembrane sensor
LGRKQKEIADQRVVFGTSYPQRVAFRFRDVLLRDDPETQVELDCAGARSTMTRATDIEQRASEWIIRSEADNFTEDMRVEMERWLREPRHRVTYLRVKEAWRRAGRFRSSRPLDGNVDPDLLKDSNLTLGRDNSNSKPKWPFRVGTTAALTLITYLLWLVGWSAFGPSKWISYTTTIGGYENITLADGTGIQLNTDTELRTRLTRRQREVQLVRGEALIKVAVDSYRPFTVRAEGTSVWVNPATKAGAAFVIRMRAPRSIDVGVTAGSVAIGASERIIDVALGREIAPDSMVEAGEIANIRPEGVHLMKVGLEELNRKLSWTERLLTFQGETLAEVTDEFNRYNRKHLVVVDPMIANRKIGGAFQADDPESFVAALQKWFGVRADEQTPADAAEGIIRLSRAN